MTTRTLNVTRSTSTAHRLHHYDGVCGNLHGHNMKWEVTLTISMDGVDESNMPVDYKTVSDVIDSVDHAILLNHDDPLLQELDIFQGQTEKMAKPQFINDDPVLGKAWVFPDGDPTCESVVKWMAERIYQVHENIEYVDVSVAETDKYKTSWSHTG